MKRNMQIESVTRSTFCATNITNTIRMAWMEKLVSFVIFVVENKHIGTPES